MANQGYRSVQVICVNDTRGNLVVQRPTIGSSSCTWIQGEQPRQGDPLPQYSSATWGVSTNDVNAGASAEIELTGLGSLPVVIVFANSALGKSTCTVGANDVFNGIVTPIDTNESTHSAFTVQLIPISVINLRQTNLDTLL